MSDYFLSTMPIPLAWLCVVAIIFAAAEGGWLVGVRYRRQHQDDGAAGSLGPVVGGLLGMLAFVLAFTFSMAAAQHATRKLNVLDEANLIGTAYLRTDLLDEATRARMRPLLREYVDVRLQPAQGGNIAAAVARSVAIHDALWDAVAAAARAEPGINSGLAVESINAVIDMHQTRITGGLRARVPTTVWVALLIITVLTMGTLGLQVGLGGKRRLIAIAPIALAFAVLVTLIVDLNRPQGGFITVNQAAMLDLQAAMKSGPP